MTESPRFSDLTLERYNLGEVRPREAGEIEAALVEDGGETAERLAAIRRSDRELRERGKEYWAALSGRRTGWMPARGRSRQVPGVGRPRLRRFLWGACAAALICALALPLLLKRETGGLSERVKGGAELSVFLKTDNSILQNEALLHEGSTVQLAYRVDRPCYGVIFSIDGRSAVTLHYPYAMGGSTGMVPGRRIALEEAYTLDDAPNYEVFFLVIGDKPLDTAAILDRAGRLAGNARNVLAGGEDVFAGYEVKTVFLKKGENE
ncbi:MAG: DUF4384 domain-containing protein [Treponema sp.]|jgi:hypothetical protein|nr:DUF4384 domain-containing protein [Treponema sp.]